MTKILIKYPFRPSRIHLEDSLFWDNLRKYLLISMKLSLRKHDQRRLNINQKGNNDKRGFVIEKSSLIRKQLYLSNLVNNQVDKVIVLETGIILASTYCRQPAGTQQVLKPPSLSSKSPKRYESKFCSDVQLLLFSFASISSFCGVCFSLFSSVNFLSYLYIILQRPDLYVFAVHWRQWPPQRPDHLRIK